MVLQPQYYFINTLSLCVFKSDSRKIVEKYGTYFLTYRTDRSEPIETNFRLIVAIFFLRNDTSKFSKIDECKVNQSNPRDNLIDRVRLFLWNDKTNLSNFFTNSSNELTNSNSWVDANRVIDGVIQQPSYKLDTSWLLYQLTFGRILPALGLSPFTNYVPYAIFVPPPCYADSSYYQCIQTGLSVIA